VIGLIAWKTLRAWIGGRLVPKLELPLAAEAVKPQTLRVVRAVKIAQNDVRGRTAV
jgi:tellurite resistance protein